MVLTGCIGEVAESGEVEDADDEIVAVDDQVPRIAPVRAADMRAPRAQAVIACDAVPSHDSACVAANPATPTGWYCYPSETSGALAASCAHLADAIYCCP